MGTDAGDDLVADDLVDFQTEIDDLQDQIDALAGASVPRVRAVAGSTTISNNTPTALPFTVADTYSYGGIHSGAADLFYAPIPGIYVITAYTIWATETAGFRRLDILANSSVVIVGQKFDAEGTDPTDISVATEVPLNTGDYIQCIVHYDASGGPSTLDIGGAYLTMRWAAPR